MRAPVYTSRALRGIPARQRLSLPRRTPAFHLTSRQRRFAVPPITEWGDMSNKHGAVYALVPLAIMACSDPQAPSPRALGPASAVVAPASGEPTGIPGFHFLPPIARGTTSGGDRDASLLDLLAVEVCEWTGSACVQPVLQRLTSHDDPPARLEDRKSVV